MEENTFCLLVWLSLLLNWRFQVIGVEVVTCATYSKSHRAVRSWGPMRSSQDTRGSTAWHVGQSFQGSLEGSKQVQTSNCVTEAIQEGCSFCPIQRPYLGCYAEPSSKVGTPDKRFLRRKGNLPTCRSNPKYLYAHLYLPIRVCQTLLEGVKNDQRGTKGEK